MDQELKENLPIFAVLVLGGVLITALSGVVLYQQFRGVSTDVQQIEQTKSSPKTVDVAASDSMDAAIVGTWESEHQKISGEGAEHFGGEGTEIYAKWVFSADGTFGYYLVNTSLVPPPANISGGYRLGTYELDSGSVDAIYFTEHPLATEPFDYGVFNFRLDSPNQMCIGDRVGGRGPQWQCYSKKSN